MDASFAQIFSPLVQIFRIAVIIRKVEQSGLWAVGYEYRSVGDTQLWKEFFDYFEIWASVSTILTKCIHSESFYIMLAFTSNVIVMVECWAELNTTVSMCHQSSIEKNGHLGGYEQAVNVYWSVSKEERCWCQKILHVSTRILSINESNWA